MTVDNEVQKFLLFVVATSPNVRQVLTVLKMRAVGLTFLINDVNSPLSQSTTKLNIFFCKCNLIRFYLSFSVSHYIQYFSTWRYFFLNVLSIKFLLFLYLT